MSLFKRAAAHYGKTPDPETPYQRAAQVWDERIGSARVQAKNWRLMAFGCLILAGGFATALVWQSARGTVVPYVVEIDRHGEARAVEAASAGYRPSDPQIAWHLARFIEEVRGLPADPIVVRQNWLRAYEFTTDRGAPGSWSVVTQPLKRGTVVYAGRLFPASRAMVEVRFLWPSKRDVNLERAILTSLDIPVPGTIRTWRALGLHVDIDARYDLVSANMQVGRICWEFATDDGHDPTISVERIAMMEYWLKQPLRDWMLEQLPGEFKVSEQGVCDISGHRAERLTSSARVSVWASLRGLRQVRLDQAWHCPIEGRVYRVTTQTVDRHVDLPPPKHLSVHCCQEPGL